MPNPDIWKYSKNTQFKKGETGSRKGQVHFKKRLTNQLMKEMGYPDITKLDKKQQAKIKGEVADALVARMIHLGLKGDMTALKYIMDKMDGPLTQKFEQVESEENLEERKEKFAKLSAKEREQLLKLMAKLND